MMKNTILIIAFLLVGGIGYAKCGNVLRVHPERGSIDPGEPILIEAFGQGEAHAILKALDREYPVYLNSKSGRVRLIQQDYKRGQKNWSQVLLFPDSKLKIGETYVLVIDQLTLKDRTYVNVDRLLRHEGFRSAGWIVERKRKFDERILDQKIETLQSKVTRYGCGPSVETTFGLNTSHFDESIILAEILDETSSFKSAYYFVVDDGKVVVGHGMCFGPYSFNEGRTYRIRFVDNYMDEKMEYTNWMKCENPWNNIE